MFSHNQRGVSLGGMLKWLVPIAVLGVLGMKAIPSAVEYGKLRKGIRSTVESVGPNATVGEVRSAFRKHLEIDHITDFQPEDLEITKENSKIVISFDYEKKIQMWGPVSLLINYKASTAGSSRE